MTLRLDRSGGELLSSQLAQWLRSAIRSGVYGPNAVLPGAVELAAAAGIGEKTARRALATLAREGWTLPKRHVGSIVRERGLPTLSRKRILFFVQESYYCYYMDQLISCIRSRLLKGRNGVSIALTCGCHGADRYLQLKEFLKEHWDLVMVWSNTQEPIEIVSGSGWPFIIIGDGKKCRSCAGEVCVGKVDIWTGKALREFVHCCARKGVHKVLQVLGMPNAYDATDMLRILGADVRTVGVDGRGTPESMSKRGFDTMRKLFAGWCAWHPDVILFTDDYVAQGGLIALKNLGVRIPEDVAVVCHANKGHGPVWEKPLTRLEMDPVSHGRELAREIAAYFRGGTFPRNIVLGSKWISGATF